MPAMRKDSELEREIMLLGARAKLQQLQEQERRLLIRFPELANGANGHHLAAMSGKGIAAKPVHANGHGKATQRERVLEYMLRKGEPVSRAAVGDDLGIDRSAAATTIKRLVESGHARRVERGLYQALADAGSKPVHYGPSRGSSSDAANETIAFVKRAGAATGTDLIKEFGIKPKAAHNRLNNLTRKGLLKRVARGKFIIADGGATKPRKRTKSKTGKREKGIANQPTATLDTLAWLKTQGPVKPADVAKRFNITTTNAVYRLRTLIERGEVKRVEKGVYQTV